MNSSNSTENLYNGWNVGTQFGLGILFDYTKRMKFGFIFNAQSDFSKFKSNNPNITSNQKIKNLNTIGILLKYKL